MRISQIQPVSTGTALDRRTPLERAREELVESLRQHPDRFAIAAVLHFVDTMRDNLRAARGSVDYSAEILAFGRVASEIETAAQAAKLPMPTTEQLAAIMAPELPAADPDADLDQMAEADARSAARRRDLRRIINHKPRSAKWNRRRNKGR